MSAIKLLVTPVCFFGTMKKVSCAIFTKFFLIFVGVPIGFFSASLTEIAKNIEDSSYSQKFSYKLNWIDLSVDDSLSMVNVVYDFYLFFFHIVFSRY